MMPKKFVTLKRPHIHMDGDYQRPFEMPTVNFVTIRNVAQLAAQRTQCCLLLGRSEQAFRELSLNFELRRLLAAKPTTLVAAMIDVAVAGLDAEVIADGFRLQAWRAPELLALQRQLQQINLLPALAASVRDERVAFCHTFESSTTREMIRVLSGSRSEYSFWKWFTDPLFLLFKFAPRGWVYQNLTASATVRQSTLEACDAERGLIKPGVAEVANRETSRLFARRLPYTILANYATPLLFRATQTTVRNQTRVNQALIACGLERYRLAQGNYPESLDALVPALVEKLPPDIIGGGPLKYRRTGDGQFLLYSVGWNEKDDGGVPGSRVDSGDWVWPMASQ